MMTILDSLYIHTYYSLHSHLDYGLEANAFIALYTANYYWKVRKDLSRARSVFADNKSRCAGSLAFWKFYLNFEYSIAENPFDAIQGLLRDCLTMKDLMYSDKLSFYDLYIQYVSTLCNSVKELLQIKADYAVWKLAAKGESAGEQEQRDSLKRDSATAMAGDASAMTAATATTTPAAATATATQTAMGMAGIPTDPNSPEYAQYYYQYYQYYGYPQAAGVAGQQ